MVCHISPIFVPPASTPHARSWYKKTFKRRQNPSKHVATLAGGFNPFEKYLSNWESSPNSGENKEYFKPPPSYSTRLRHRNKWVASFQRCKLLPPIFFCVHSSLVFSPPRKNSKKEPKHGNGVLPFLGIFQVPSLLGHARGAYISTVDDSCSI